MGNSYEMSHSEMSRIYAYNNIRRARLLNRVNSLTSDVEKVQYIISYFTNNLPKEVIADIDDVSESEVVNFEYDYSFVRGTETHLFRKSKVYNYPQGYGITLSNCDNDYEIEGRPKIYPTIYSLKSGTCTMFANEIKRLMSNIGIDCNIIEEKNADCYDYYEGRDFDGHEINVNSIKKITHFYNTITLDGKQYKIDIAGYLTAQDYNKYNPNGIKNPLDISKFIMSEDLESKPFSDALASSITD